MSRPVVIWTLVFALTPVKGADPEIKKNGAPRPEWEKCAYLHPIDGTEHKGFIRLILAMAHSDEHRMQIRRTLSLEGGGRAEIEESSRALQLELLGEAFNTRPVQFRLIRGRMSAPENFEVRFGPVSYIDLDGNGTIDCWIKSFNDKVGERDIRRASILFENRVLDVDTLKSHYTFLVKRNDPPMRMPEILLAAAEASVASGKADYHFAEGKWKCGVAELPPARGPINVPRARIIGREEPPGPEWIRIRKPYVEGGLPSSEYIRPGAIVSYREENDNKTRHTLLLDHGGGLDIYERDDKSAITLELIGKKPTDRLFYFHRQLDSKGQPTRHEVRFGSVTYFDLDGDGVIDCWIDQRAGDRKPCILFDNRVVPVEDAKELFQSAGIGNAWSEGRKVQYKFEKGKWTGVTP
jgi:hypothetical protein